MGSLRAYVITRFLLTIPMVLILLVFVFILLRVMHGDPGRKKIAIVATAHYLVRVMAAMLRTGEVWRDE